MSHFDVLWDDLQMSWSYARLAFGMLARACRLPARQIEQPR